jgi:hypothetical protein
MNAPNWIWIGIGLLIILAILYLVGVRITIHA